MLQDDGHLLRILREQPRRKLHAFGGGQEGDEEMMLARQPMLGGIAQDRRRTPRSASRASTSYRMWSVAMVGPVAIPRRRRRRSPDLPFPMLPRRKPGQQPSGREIAAGGPQSKRRKNEVEASVARCLRTPPDGA